MDVSALMAVGGALVGGLGWLFNLQNRINAHEASCTQRQNNLDERHRHIEATLTAINAKLDRLMAS